MGGGCSTESFAGDARAARKQTARHILAMAQAAVTSS